MRRITYLLFLILIVSCQSNNQDEKPKNNSSVTPFDQPPAWSNEVVWYQIFVERFRNGDTSNDPTPEDIDGCYPGFIPENWTVTPWEQDWYKPDPYFEALEGVKDFNGNPVTNFHQKVQMRRYGGDLQGVLDKLDYLEELGITAIYFNPLNDAPSLHKYDPRHWRHIDRNFGPTPREDVKMISEETPDDPATWKMTGADQLFVKVLEELHKRGIKVIMDYSWNHTGHRFWAWNDIVEKQEASEYKDWFWVESFDDPETEENEFKYKGWFGVGELPEIKETELIDHAEKIKVAEGNIYSEKAKHHIFNVTQRWLDPNGDGDPIDGVDGFRLDVAAEMPLDFWREYRKVVRDLNPDAYLVGEIWWEQYPDHLLEPEPFLKGDIFDAVMNYRWYRAARHFFNRSPNQIASNELVDSLNSFSDNLRKGNNYAMINLVASHDVPRVATSLFNKNKYKMGTSVMTGEYNINKPDAATYDIQKALLIHQFTYVGSPHIWAGDEMGMWGADDPDCRKPLIWPDLTFDNETHLPIDGIKNNDSVAFNTELFEFYKSMIDIRRSNEVLVSGDLQFLNLNTSDQVFAYSRFSEAEEIIVIFNRDSTAQTIQLPAKFSARYRDLLSAATFQIEGDYMELTIEPNHSMVLNSNGM